MNFRNKDLIQVFEERYRANHNEKLNKEIAANKKNTTDRMFGNNRKPDNLYSKDAERKVIGYDSFKRNRGA